MGKTKGKGSFDETVDRVKGRPIRRKSELTSTRTSLLGKHALAVPGGGGKGGSKKGSRISIHGKSGHKKSASSVGSTGSSGGSSAGSGSDLTRRRKRRKAKEKDKKDNVLTRLRDYVAEGDVFVEHRKTPPHITCIQVSIITVPLYTIFLIWDTLAATTFEMPHLSMIDFPGFMLVFQFTTILLAMYGYSVQFVSTGSASRYVTIAKIALALQYILFGWRVFIELYFDGYRFQEKGYLPRGESEL